MDLMVYTVLVPLVAGAILRIIPDAAKGAKETLALIVAAVTFWFTIDLFRQGFMETRWYGSTIFRLDTLSSFILLAAGFFGVVMILYSLGFMKGKKNLKPYYGNMILSLGAAYGAILANDMILLLAFWGFLALTLYNLINVAGPRASGAAKKTMIVVGGTDAVLVLGVAIVWMMTGSTSLTQQSIPTITGLSAFAFILFVAAAFAKAAVMPFHSWMPDAAEYGPTSAVAFLPATVDKLLGVYLLARVSFYLFNLTPGMQLMLLIVGSVTILAAMMMALVQRDLNRVLSYCAISQAGYIVLGIGTLNPVGIAGGLFHMLNHTIYKGGLFLGSGAVQSREGTTKLDKLGGLGKYMPVTFITFLIGALAVSGIPPLNGFVSKWMLYQGLLELGKQGGVLWVIWLVVAMFGSVLTFALLMRAVHSTFLGQREKKGDGPKEVGWTMALPMIVLAALCVIFGIFAFSLPLKHFIYPAVSSVVAVPDIGQWLGWWSPALATLLIAVGIVIGFIVYLAGQFKTRRVSAMYVGGEILPEATRVTGTEFYQTIQDMGFFSGFYKWAEQKAFDAYEIGRALTSYFIRGLRALHGGVLPEYLTWMLAGLLVLIVILLR
jgi:formate hydrogenlyase subunit 3/multisubunit Na+/H+ antiporter MnhD subunit